MSLFEIWTHIQEHSDGIIYRYSNANLSVDSLLVALLFFNWIGRTRVHLSLQRFPQKLAWKFFQLKTLHPLSHFFYPQHTFFLSSSWVAYEAKSECREAGGSEGGVGFNYCGIVTHRPL